MAQIKEFDFSDVLGVLNDVELKHVPKKGYYLGELSLFSKGARVSIIGTRKPTPEGIRRANIVAKKLVAEGITIVSGMAEGVDTLAHTVAIENRGKTIAVLGTPLDKPYPKSNMGLFEHLSNNQLVISQFETGYPFSKRNFPIRNRTMALISHATVIIEASENSGTIHQGWEALRLGRPLYLLESLVKNSNLTWPEKFIEYGARVLTRDNFDDLLNELPTVELYGLTHLSLND